MNPKKLPRADMPKTERHPQFARVLMSSFRLPADLAALVNAHTSKPGEYSRFMEQAVREQLAREQKASNE